MPDDETLAIILAVLAAMSWGFSAILVRQGLRYIQTATGTLISLTAGFLFTGSLVLIFERDALLSVSLTAVLLFAVIGILNFPMGRFLNYLSMSHLGVGRSTPILASAPLFAIILAAIFTDETIDLATLVGTGMILAGLYVTVKAPAKAAAANASNSND